MNKLEIEVSSDLDFDDLIANILFDGELVARLSQEVGFEKLQIEIFPPLEKKAWGFSFDEFDAAIHLAKNSLFKMKKID